MFHMSVQGFVMVMEVLGLVFGVIGTFVVFFVFMAKKNEERYTGRMAKFCDFLNFRFYIIESVLKFCYVLTACLCTSVGLFMALTVVELTKGLILLAGGNLAARMVFEFIMMLVKACRNLGVGRREEKPQIYIEKKPEIEVPYEKENVPVKAEEASEKTTAKKKIIIRKEPRMEGEEEKCKVCPSCGEKCSSKFAFCNMCGSKL